MPMLGVRSVKRANRRYQPTFDRLEDRWTPAGNVTASLSFGTLTLTGDALSNSIDISQTGFESYEITGFATTITRGGVVTPAGTPVTISGVANIVANLGGGADLATC